VKAKLLVDNIMRGASISVDTFEGYITLTGVVENTKKRERATAIVKSVYGVGKVNNLLMIKEQSGHSAVM
jgi:hyperosmotically inducible protein